MSKEIYLYSKDKKYKCAVELADSCDRFGCPDHSVIILTEERPDGTYIIAEARDRILETEKDQQISDLQHRLDVAKKALELACETMRYELGRESIKNLYKDAMKNLKNNLNMEIDKGMCQWYLEQAEKELKGE
jgi:hypothetical protein